MTIVLHNSACPLCRTTVSSLYFRDSRRDFYQCPACSLAFVPTVQFISFEDEKKRYDLHRNSLADAGYRSFLEQLVVPLSARLKAGSNGLDFGSGPEPVLALLMRKAGHAVTLFDPFYEPAHDVFDREYDFITACEVVEHLREPGRELDRLWRCLKKDGWLGIMTQFLVDREAFPNWHYKNDPTHICFYASGTFSWLAERWQASLEFPADNVVLIRKA